MFNCKLSPKYTTSVILSAMILAGSHIAAFAKADEAPRTPEEQAETDNRKACKIKVCQVFASKKAEGEDVSCDLVKTVHKETIEKKYLGGKIGWPFGKAQCKTSIKLKRAFLVNGATKDGFEGTLEKTSVDCILFTSDGKDKHEIKFSLAPTIKWKGGKAETVALNITDISGTALAKTGLWTIAKANSYFGVLDGPVMGKFNDFTTACPEYLAGNK